MRSSYLPGDGIGINPFLPLGASSRAGQTESDTPPENRPLRCLIKVKRTAVVRAPRERLPPHFTGSENYLNAFDSGHSRLPKTLRTTFPIGPSLSRANAAGSS